MGSCSPRPRFFSRVWALLAALCLAFIPLSPPALAASPASTQEPPLPEFLHVGGPNPFPRDAELLEVFFLNVGQGDAIFLRVGSQTLLIDGGYPKSFSQLESFLQKEQGSLRVGSLLFTHPHEDHISAPTALLRRGGGASRAYGNLGRDSSNALFASFLAQADARSIPYTQLASGDLLELGGQGPDRGATPIPGEDFLTQGSALLRILRWEDSTQDVNAQSLVIHLEYGLRTLLLTADITGVSQHHFFKTQGSLLASDILKSPHHGVEPFQSDFLSAVSPSLAVVTNTPRASRRAGEQMALRGIPALYSGEGDVYLATDGEVWYARQDGGK